MRIIFCCLVRFDRLSINAILKSITHIRGYIRNRKDSTQSVNRRPERSTNSFELLDYEFSVQVIYKVKDWVFLLVPTYTIPINPSTATVTTTTRKTVNGKTTVKTTAVTTTEKISNSFFLELDISHRFHRKAKKASE